MALTRHNMLIPLFIIAFAVSGVRNQDPPNRKACGGIETKEKKDFPNIFGLVQDTFYELFVEITFKNSSETFYAKEYYDIITKQGIVEFKSTEKADSIFYYDSNTREAFVVEGNKCTTQKACDTNIFDQDFFFSRWKYCDAERVVIGPSAMLYQGYMETKVEEPKEPMKYCGEQGGKVRGMKVHLWAQELQNGDLVEYFFADQTVAKQLVYGDWLPVRVTYTSGLTSGDAAAVSHQTYEIISFLPRENVGKVDSLPKGYGCTRLSNDDNITPPKFTSSNWYMEAEIVTIDDPLTSSKSNITAIKMMYDMEAKTYAYETTPWVQVAGSKTNVKKDDAKFIFYDTYSGIKYVVDEETNKCTKSKGIFRPNITLPAGGEVFLDEEYFFTGEQGYQYLGQDRVRDIPALVFEKAIKSQPYGKQKGKTEHVVVYTRYVAGEEVNYYSNVPEKHVPLKLEIRSYSRPYNPDEETPLQLNQLVVFNVFDFTTLILDKRHEFYMRPCYAKPGEGIWFQVSFPATTEQLMKLWDHMAAIENEFTEEMILELGLSVMRMGEVMIDFDAKNVHITAFLVERPSYFLEFLPPEQGKTLVDPDSDPESAITQEECAKSCIEFGCTAFSYCGATCYQTSDELQEKNIAEGKDCVLYRRYSEYKPMPPADEILDNLQLSILKGEFVLSVPLDVPDVIELTAVGRVEKIASGLTRIIHKHEKEVDIFFQRVKSAKRLISKDVIHYPGKVSYTDCKLACLNTQDCETISFCASTSDCLLSKKHGDELQNKDMKDDTQCSIMTKRYSHDYKEFKGIVLTTKAKEERTATSLENCAKLCSTAKGYTCQSFDYCLETEGASNCLLHTSHIKDDDGKSVKSANKLKKCSHHSRNYMKNFQAMPGKRMKNANKLISEQGLTLDECSYRCAISSGCVSFDFCNVLKDTQSLCVFGTQKYSESELESKDICTHYNFLEKRSLSEIEAVQIIEEKKEEPGHSNGLAAGMGILFFVIGGILGAVALFVYGYLKANR